MRRILLALCTTATALVLLFGYRTSTGAALSTPPVVTAAAPSGTTSSSGTTSGSGTTADSGTGSGSSGSTTATSASYAGDVVQTRWVRCR